MSLSCYILDDETHALDLLQAYIGRTPGLTLAGRQTRPLEALEELDRQSPDVLFIDVDMPDLSGLELARILKGRAAIIFTTSFREFGPEAFELPATDYLLKPFLYERFLQAVQRVYTAHSAVANQPASDLYVKTGVKGQLQQVRIAEISYVAGLQAYVEIVQASGKVISYLSLTELLNRLPASQFTRIHKSYIVNHKFVARLEPGQLRLQDGTVLPIGRSFREDLLKKLAPFTVTGGRGAY